MSPKLPDFLQDGSLNSLRQQMGATALGSIPEPDFTSTRLTFDERERLLDSGIDIKSLDEIRKLDDGTLAYKDRRIILYIRDVPRYSGRSVTEQNMPRFHISNCDKLREMRSQQRIGRYVVAARQDGYFQINLIEGEVINSSIENLKVCQRCLEQLHWENFSQTLPQTTRHDMVRRFSLKKFFETYPRDLLDANGFESEGSGPINDYTGDVGVYALQIKELAGYKCSICHIDLSPRHLRKFLHAHHINGVKHDNSLGNLAALCIGCHAEQPHHSHMKGLGAYREFMQGRV